MNLNLGSILNAPWMNPTAADVACRTAPELWQPHARGQSAITEAKAECAKCPVRAGCLTWAIENDEHGIWGGTTEDERAAMKPQPAS